MSVKGEGAGLDQGRRQTATQDKLVGESGGDDACWTCPGATVGQYGLAFIPLLAHSLDEGSPGEGMTSGK